jgi:ABC-2 type transport system ATP-binding protein
MTELAIKATGLTKKFKKVTAVNHIDLEIKKGEIFGLVGPDGAGKSTTIRMLTTVFDPTEGEAFIGGAHLTKERAAVKDKIGYMSEVFSLYGDLTVKENLEFFADLYNVNREGRQEKINQLLDFARLNDFTGFPANNLSGGMKQKLALACTLIRDPEVLFLDEPTTGVDPLSRRDFWRILSKLHRNGVTLFITTPYMDEAERCSRVAFMQNGKIILCDTPSAIRSKVKGELFEIRANPSRSVYKLLFQKGYSVQVFGETIQLLTQKPEEDKANAQNEILNAGYKIDSIRPISQTMESAFFYLMG